MCRTGLAKRPIGEVTRFAWRRMGCSQREPIITPVARRLMTQDDACSDAKQRSPSVRSLDSGVPTSQNYRTTRAADPKIICTQYCTPLTILAPNPPKSAQVRRSPKPLATQALSPIVRNSPDAHKRAETPLARLGVKGSWVRIPPARQCVFAGERAYWSLRIPVRSFPLDDDRSQDSPVVFERR